MKSLYIIVGILIFTLHIQGCRRSSAEEAFMTTNVRLDKEVIEIPYREITLPLPLPPAPRGNFMGKDPRQFPYEDALKGWAPVFVTLDFSIRPYRYIGDNYYVATFTSRNQIVRERGDDLLDETFNVPIAYMIECEPSYEKARIVAGRLQRLSETSFCHFLTRTIERRTSAVVLFTKDYIYLKSYSEKCFRRYLRKPHEIVRESDWRENLSWSW